MDLNMPECYTKPERIAIHFKKLNNVYGNIYCFTACLLLSPTSVNELRLS